MTIRTEFERRVVRRGTAAAWTAANPVLLDGEEGLETDTRRTKMGDGVTAWATLAYDLDAATASSTYGRRNAHVLYAADYVTEADRTTDAIPGINAMVAAGNALVTAGNGHIVFQFDDKEYVLASAPTHPGGAGGAYAQIPLPTRTSTDARATFEFRGTATAVMSTALQFNVLESAGTVLRSTATGGLDATYGLASVIGGPAWKSTGTHDPMTGTGWSNITVGVNGLTIRRPDNPSIAGADFSYCQAAKTNNLVLDTNIAPASIAYPTHFTNIGLLMPEVSNNCVSACDGDTLILGAYVAIRYSEHFIANHLWITFCVLAFAAAPGMLGSVITRANCDSVPYIFGEIDPATGLVPAIGNSHTRVLSLGIGDTAVGPWATVVHINDMSGALSLDASYVVVPSSGPQYGPMTFNGYWGDATYDLKNLKIPSNWIDITSFVNGWSSAGGAWGNVSYRKDRDGYVRMSGSVLGGANGTFPFTLPAGYRPGAQKSFVVDAYAGGVHSAGSLDVTTGGDFYIATSGGPQISLDQVYYRAEL